MDRWACLSIFELPLQLLLNRSPEWAQCSVAVVDDDKPTGHIKSVNTRAYERGVRPGYRYTTALMLEPQLRAAAILEDELQEAIQSIVAGLFSYTPCIESHPDFPGIFWLNVSGLAKLFRSLEEWGRQVTTLVKGWGYQHTLVIGYSRFGTYALARSFPQTHPNEYCSKTFPSAYLLSDSLQEAEETRSVRLEFLGLSKSLLENLHKLGLEKLGDFLELPMADLSERFGKEAYSLYQLADNAGGNPGCPYVFEGRMRRNIALEYAESDAIRLTFLVKSELRPLLESLAAKGRSLASLQIFLELGSKEVRTELIQPAEPTLDERQVLDLVRLRFETLRLVLGVTEITLTVEGLKATTEQLRLFDQVSTRNLKAANLALARVRMTLGSRAIGRVELCDAHLPEARFRIVPMDSLEQAKCQMIKDMPLVRRFFNKLQFFVDPNTLVRRDTFPPGMEIGKIRSIVGPDIISGGWWKKEVQREYFYVETYRGEILWAFYDCFRRRWRLQGRLE